MTVRKISFSIDEHYHIYSRGVDKRKIFLNGDDYRRFIRLMFLCNGEEPVVYRETENQSLKEIRTGKKLIAIGAYCLMPNHFHLLVREITEGGTVRFMSKLLTAYSAYFNKKHARTGALFGSEFKAEHLDTDEYLKYIFAYIHLNPLKLVDSEWRIKRIDWKTAKQHLAKYQFSSYTDYTEEVIREYSLVLNKKIFPEYFPQVRDFQPYIRDWIELDYFT